jgi:hypothetical protein
MLELLINTSFYEKTTISLSDILRSEMRKKLETSPTCYKINSVVLTSNDAFNGKVILNTEDLELSGSHALTTLSDVRWNLKQWYTLTLLAPLEYHTTHIHVLFEPVFDDDPTDPKN